jgi:hypothetical protein
MAKRKLGLIIPRPRGQGLQDLDVVGREFRYARRGTLDVFDGMKDKLDNKHTVSSSAEH